MQRSLYFCVFIILCNSTFLSEYHDIYAAENFLPDLAYKPAPEPEVLTPGPSFMPPVSGEPEHGTPVIYSHSQDAGPDESLFLTGEGFSRKTVMFGTSVKREGGGEIPHQVLTVEPENMIVAPDQLEPDGLYLFWAGNDRGYSSPVRINAPQVWWSAPKNPVPGSVIRIFGRNLARRPDFKIAYVYLNKPGKGGYWLEVTSASKYEVQARLPDNIEPGEYEVWVHAGNGGTYGWSEPVMLSVATAVISTGEKAVFGPEAGTAEIQNALNQGRRVHLKAGVYTIGGGLTLPANAYLEGEGQDKTILQLAQEPGPQQSGRGSSGWGKAISRLVGGGTLDYDIRADEAGTYVMWYRYRYTDDASREYTQPENIFNIEIDGEEPEHAKTPAISKIWVWAKAAEVDLREGWNRMRLRQQSRGEVLIDALVFSKEKGWSPGKSNELASSESRIIVQAEDVIHMQSWKGRLPGRAYAGVWLAGDNTALSNLSVLGSPQVAVGVLIADDSKISWMKKAEVRNVRIADIDGVQMNNCGILAERAEEVIIENCDITARNPVYLKGFRYGRISNNRLASVTRSGGNGEGFICSRTSILHQNIMEDNVFCSPYRGAGYTGRRMIWVSTGVGSVDNNVFRGNRVERTHFGGVAGTDQNVGEMFLFEWCSQTAYHGHPVTARRQSITLPEEGPYRPEPEGAEKELPLNTLYDGDAFLEQFYVMIVKGRGQGQTRRVISRRGDELFVARPWDVIPDENSLIVMNTLFVRNLVIDNEITDGMTGVQLWIGCVENVIADNIIKRQRRQAIFVYACMQTSEVQVPRMWNAGIGPSYYNFIEGNNTDECASGILFSSSQGVFSHGLPTGVPYAPQAGPMDWPLLLGNVARQNSAARSRSSGIQISASRSKDVPGEAVPAAVGNIVEFNLLRDSWESGVRIGNLTDISVVRRNHIYFWFRENDTELPIGIDIRGAKNAIVENNNVENKRGGELRTPNRVVKE